MSSLQEVLEKAAKRIIIKVGNEAKNHFQDNIRLRQGYNGKKWPKRKPRGHKLYKNKQVVGFRQAKRKPSDNRNILIGTGATGGALLKSIRVGNGISRNLEIKILANAYGKYHNLGIAPQPQRTFMVMDNELKRKITAISRNEIKKALSQ